MFWGLSRLLNLGDVGTAIPGVGPIDTQTRKKKSVLTRIHSAEYVDGDITRLNFCRKAGVVFLG
jgi:hypothetical protein